MNWFLNGVITLIVSRNNHFSMTQILNILYFNLNFVTLVVV